MGVSVGPKVPVVRSLPGNQDGTFSDSTNWAVTPGSLGDSDNWSISGGVASIDGSQDNTRWLIIQLTQDRYYKIKLDVISYSKGTLSLSYGTGGTTSGTEMNKTGSFVFTGQVTGNAICYIRAGSTFIGTIDNVEVEEVDVNGNSISPLCLSLDAANSKSYAGDPVTNMVNGATVGGMGQFFDPVTNLSGGLEDGGVTNPAARHMNFQKLNNKGQANCFASSNGKIYISLVGRRATANSSDFNNNGGFYIAGTHNQTSGTDDGYMILSFWRYLSEAFEGYGTDGLGQAYLNYRNSSGGSTLNFFDTYRVDGATIAGHTAGEQKCFGDTAELNKWQYVQVIETSKESSGANTPAVTAVYVYADKNQKGSMYIANLMLEDRNDGSTFAMPYTATSRSATNGWKDLSGKANHGTLVNGTRIGRNHYVAGQVVYCDDGDDPPALDFDGSNDYVEVSSNGSTNFASQTYTISGWFKLNSSRSNDSVFFSYDHTAHSSPHYAAHFRIGTTNGILFGWNDGSSYEALEKASAVSDNTWHHFAATFKKGKQAVYIDGDEAATSTHSDTITFYSQEVWIGRGNYGGYFNGKIATAQFYNTALSHQQVKEIYNSQRGRYGK